MHLLGIDLGTSGTKATIVDASGRVVCSATREHPLHTPRPGWSEQDPADWWGSTCLAVRAAMAEARLEPRAIGGIGLSGQMHGLVMVDAGGSTIRPCILWNDQRSAEECRRVEAELSIQQLVARTGNRMLPGFTAPKILWCRRHEPAAESRAAKHLLPKDWLRWRMSGIYATEVSDASGTLLFDCARRRWSEEMLAGLRIDRGTMPDCAESPMVTAHLSPAAANELGLLAGTPIAGGAGDQAAQAVGAGVVAEGMVSVTIGTSGVAFASSDAWRPSAGGELHAFCHAVPGRWHVMGVMLSAGGSLRWHRDTACRDLVEEAMRRGVDPYELLIGEAATAPTGCEGLTFLPYLSGERCPHPDPHARGALVGLSAAHGRGHVSRAVLEGITFGLLDNLDLIRSVGIRADEILLAGGGARSPFWHQLCADAFGLPVAVASGDEGGALGVALLAGVGIGVWPDVAAACAAVAKGRTLRRVLPGREAGSLAAPCRRFRALYPLLRPAFESIASG